VENFPGSLCPSNPESLPLLKAMLEQAIKMHPNIKMLHIGADEVVNFFLWNPPLIKNFYFRFGTLVFAVCAKPE